MRVCCANTVFFSLRLAFLVGILVAVASCSGREPESSGVDQGGQSERGAANRGSASEAADSSTAGDLPPTTAPSAASRDQTVASQPDGDYLPPLVYMCPCDPRIVEDEPGLCPDCGEELMPVRITLAYSCLGNTAFIQDTPGQCRTDGTDLVPISASMFWECSDAPGERLMDPGTCADGSERIRKFEALQHGDHNPRHGGEFFMADDAWHHLEGTYPSDGLFRVFFYNDWTEPLEPEGFRGRLIVMDSSQDEVATVPLEPSKISNAMDARIPEGSLPLIASLRVSFEPGQPEKFFDFRFTSYSEEPVALPLASEVVEVPSPSALASATPSAPQPLPPPASATPSAPAPPAPDSPSPDVPPRVDGGRQTVVLTTQGNLGSGPKEEPIPTTLEGILAEFNAQSENLATQIEDNEPLGLLWVPAIRAKNLALAAITGYLDELPAKQQVIAEDAVSRLLRAAYAIDNFGDLGDREAIVSVHKDFARAVDDFGAAYATIR